MTFRQVVGSPGQPCQPFFPLGSFTIIMHLCRYTYVPLYPSLDSLYILMRKRVDRVDRGKHPHAPAWGQALMPSPFRRSRVTTME